MLSSGVSPAAAVHARHIHDPKRAIALRLASIFLFTSMAACIKLCEQKYPTSQIVFFRSFFALFPLLPLIYLAGLKSLHTKRPLGHLGRGILGLAAMSATFFALPRLELATYITLNFTMPLFAAVLAVLWLKEKLKPSQALALLCGFAGVLLILRPDLGLANYAVLVALLGAFLVAIVMIVVRQLTATENSLSIVVWFTLFCTAVSAAVMAFEFVPLTLRDVLLLSSAGLIGGIAQIWLTQSFRYGNVSQLGGLEYTGLLWATLFGYFLWQEVPDSYTLIGAGIIIASGLYMASHATRSQRRLSAVEAAGRVC
jgi:drug/metabolite transporter (DMT)-like permease